MLDARRIKYVFKQVEKRYSEEKEQGKQRCFRKI